MLNFWKSMNSKRVKKARGAQSLLVGCALLIGLGSWNLMAKDDDTDQYSSGDSVGTLPVQLTGPTSVPGVAELTGMSWRQPAGLTMIVPGAEMRRIVQSSSGAGHFEWSPLENDRVQLRLMGAGQLTLDPDLVADGTIELVLQSESLDPWFYAVQVGGWWSAPAVADEAGIALDLTRTLPDQWGAAPLTIHTRVWPSQVSRLEFSREGGLISVSQAQE